MVEISKYISEFNNKTLFFCHSFIHVLVAYTIILRLDIKRENIFIVILNLKDTNQDTLRQVMSTIKSQDICVFTIRKGGRIGRIIGMSDLINNRVVSEIMDKAGILENDWLFVDFSWNQEFIYYPSTLFYKRAPKVILIEEGITQYTMPKQTTIQKAFRHIYHYYPGFWKDNRVKRIYVQKPENFDKEIFPYLTHFEYRFGGLTGEEKEMIVQMFVGDGIEHFLNLYRKKINVIIFTQPLSEDGYISEKRKKEIYRNIVNEYSKHGSVIIKKHPRDYSDYSDICENIDDFCYPSEILNILGISFDYAVGVSTGAIYSVTAKEKRNIDELFLKKRRIDRNGRDS